MSAEHARATPRVSDERLAAWDVRVCPSTVGDLVLDLRDARRENERLRAERDALRALRYELDMANAAVSDVRRHYDKALAAARTLRDATDAADTMIGDMLMAYEHGAERPGVDELYVRDVQRTVASALTATRWLAAPEPQEPGK